MTRISVNTSQTSTWKKTFMIASTFGELLWLSGRNGLRAAWTILNKLGIRKQKTNSYPKHVKSHHSGSRRFCNISLYLRFQSEVKLLFSSRRLRRRKRNHANLGWKLNSIWRWRTAEVEDKISMCYKITWKTSSNHQIKQLHQVIMQTGMTVSHPEMMDKWRESAKLRTNRKLWASLNLDSSTIFSMIRIATEDKATSLRTCSSILLILIKMV